MPVRSARISLEAIRSRRLVFGIHACSATNGNQQKCMVVERARPQTPCALSACHGVSPQERREFDLSAMPALLGRRDPTILEIGCNDGSDTLRFLATRGRNQMGSMSWTLLDRRARSRRRRHRRRAKDLAVTRYFYTEYSNQELYEGQLDLQRIINMLPGFEVVEIFNNDVLMRNKRLT